MEGQTWPVGRSGRAEEKRGRVGVRMVQRNAGQQLHKAVVVEQAGYNDR